MNETFYYVDEFKTIFVLFNVGLEVIVKFICSQYYFSGNRKRKMECVLQKKVLVDNTLWKVLWKVLSTISTRRRRRRAASLSGAFYFDLIQNRAYIYASKARTVRSGQKSIVLK
jgi:hypothetical protein